MDDREKNQSVRQKLRELRKAKGLTVDRFAEKVGVSSQKVSRIERGKTNFSIDYLMQVTNALDAPLQAVIPPSQKKEMTSIPSSGSMLSQVLFLYEQRQHILDRYFNIEEKSNFIASLVELAKLLPESKRYQSLSALFDQLILPD